MDHSFPMHARPVREREEVSERFFIGTGRSYDRVAAICSWGLDKRWKRRLMEHVPPAAARILDLACGTGILLEMLAGRAPDAALVGVDYTRDYLDVALRRFEGRPLDLRLIHANAEAMELDGTFDCVVSSYLPKYVNASHLFERLEGHVAPGAVMAFHDFGHPHAFARVVWRAHMAVLERLGPHLFPGWDACFGELAELIRHSRWQDSYAATFERFGYENVRVEKLSFRTAYIVSGRRPS